MYMYMYMYMYIYTYMDMHMHICVLCTCILFETNYHFHRKCSRIVNTRANHYLRLSRVQPVTSTGQGNL